MIRERYLMSKHDLECLNAKVDTIKTLSAAITYKSNDSTIIDYIERINKAIDTIECILTVGKNYD